MVSAGSAASEERRMVGLLVPTATYPSTPRGHFGSDSLGGVAGPRFQCGALPLSAGGTGSRQNHNDPA
jgi:hypothetical protein